MATVTGYTAAHLEALLDENVVDADVVNGHLILTKRDGTTFDAGSVIGPRGLEGPALAALDDIGDVNVTGAPDGKWLKKVAGLWAAADLPADPTKTIRKALVYTLPGEIKVGVGSTDYLPGAPLSVPAGQTVTLVGYRWIGPVSGTSFTFKITHYRPSPATSTDLTAGIVAAAGRGGGTFTPKTCLDNDEWYPIITAVNGTPIGGVIAVLVDVTV